MTDVRPTCSECGGIVVPRPTAGFSACVDCGKLIVTPLPDVRGAAQDDAAGDATVVEVGENADQLMEVEVGWRAWAVDLDCATRGVMPLLKSVTHGDFFWTPRMEMIAVCPKQGERHEVPSKSCTCGLYAARDRDHLMSLDYPSYTLGGKKGCRVIGEVSLGGGVIPGTQGWRAQSGYPRRLFVPYEAARIAKPLSECYGVPVALDNWLSEPLPLPSRSV